MIEEDISPGDHHAREMYATYGAAMYHSQVFEAGVKQALLTARMADKQFETLDQFDEATAKQLKTVLGRLVERLKPFIADEVSLNSRLQLALSVRNELAHHFFWDHAADAMTKPGRDLMMGECRRAINLFMEVSAELHRVVQRFSIAAGISERFTAENVAEEQRRLSLERTLTRDSLCGRCGGIIMEVTTGGWHSSRCTACGAVSLR